MENNCDIRWKQRFQTYDFSTFREVLDAVSARYLAALAELHLWFMGKRIES